MKNNLEILYEDNHVIVVVKPCNVLSQADNTKDLDMLSLIKNYLKEKYNKPGNVYLGLVHRLDRPTGGIMVFAKTSKAASRLSDNIREGKFYKKYCAIVCGYLDNKRGYLENYLVKEDNNSIVVDDTQGKFAKLFYEVKKKKDSLSLVDIELYTGRHHQIRVQFAHIGHPLLGDRRYGNTPGQLALYAYELSFVHPVTKELLTFKKIPKEGIWNKFF